ncbi:MAG TPA: Fic family protein [Stellaceae bacterium]|nr:Fic family protein [Stellaceae bacterium]
MDAATFARYAQDLTEAQLERVLPAYAELALSAADPIDHLTDLVLRRFGYPGRAPDDRGENISLMEPLLLGESSRHRHDLSNLAADLLAESKEFTGALPPGLRRPLADLVRAMNCYYSNLIEGHDTHPIDIERALKQVYSDDPKKRDLQLEAKAHIAVQYWIDSGGLAGREPVSQAALCNIHERFCSALPDALLWLTNPDTNERWRLSPGNYREQDVKIGSHIPPSPGALPRFMSRFETTYSRLGKLDLILATPAAHHRLLWIHPFADGNGRVARLMSHATLSEALNNHGLWSVARGLARAEAEYKGHLHECDLVRRNDLDGRGQLSEEALAGFTRFFLNRCLDQVRFMRSLMQPDTLRTRWGLWITEQAELNRLPRIATRLLNALLAEGDLGRIEAVELLGLPETKVTETLTYLEEEGVVVPRIDDNRLTLAFPVKLAERITPGLFP